MSHTIIIPDELYHAIEEYAARRGETAEAAVLAWAEQLAHLRASAPSTPETGPENGHDDSSRVDDPAYDPWAGFRRVAVAKSADSVDRHDEYLAEDPLAAFLGKGELTSPDAIRRHDEVIADEALDAHRE